MTDEEKLEDIGYTERFKALSLEMKIYTPDFKEG